MFVPNTVLVLGAGASSDYGFPTGPTLKEKILADVAQAIEQIRSQVFIDRVQRSNFGEVARTGIYAVVRYVEQQKLSQDHSHDRLRDAFSLGALHAFHDDLSRSSAQSIDRFIFENSSHGLLGRALIAQHVLLRMYESDEHGRAALRPFDEIRGWYKLLVAHLTDGAQSARQLESNPLTIITFNYEQSLRIALERLIPRAQRYADVQVCKCVNILHVNGSPEIVPETLVDAVAFILDAAPKLHLFRDDANEALDDIREQARKAIRRASRIYIMGFAFEGQNCINIDLAHRRRDTDNTYFVNYDGDIGLTRAARAYAIVQAEAGSNTELMTISRAITRNFFIQ